MIRPGARVNGHAGGLVDHQNVGIFIQNFDGDVFGFGGKRGARADLDFHDFPGVDAVRGARGTAVYENQAFRGQFLNAGAAEFND